MQYSSLSSIQQELAAGTLTSETMVRYFLARIEEVTHLNCYVEVYPDEALQLAREQDSARAAGREIGPLDGLVISIKDVLCHAGHGVSAGSRMLEHYRSPFSATAVERLLAAGAIIIGRTNCDEFAMGSANENSHYGPTRNAADPTRVPGGSSGGAAVSVQAGTCTLAIGSSTGGSVRQPAAFCGLYGFKPTYGRISRHGLLAYGSSFDQIGVLGHEPTDIALVTRILAGADDFDATASTRPVPDYAAEVAAPATGETYRISYLGAALDHPGIDPEIAARCREQLAAFARAGHTVTEVSFNLLDYVVPTYYVLTTAEASSNLSRYDGLRFGHRAEGAKTLEEMYRRSRSEGFGTEVQRRILLGTYVLSSGYYDAYFGKAQQVRRLIRDRLLEILAEHDFIFLPVSPVLPWRVGDRQDDPVANYLADIFTVVANLAGLPALAVPAGTGKSGLPIGWQLMGRPWEEGKLLRAGDTLTDPGRDAVG